MNGSFRFLLLPALVFGLGAVHVSADTVTQVASNAAGTSYNSGATWSSQQAPSAGNDYLSGRELVLRTPFDDDVFAGDSLIIGKRGALWLKGRSGGSTSTYTFNGGGLVLDGGTIVAQNNNPDENSVFAGKFTVKSDSTLDLGNLQSGCVTIAAELLGSGTLTVRKNTSAYSPRPSVIIAGARGTFKGTIVLDGAAVVGFGSGAAGFGLAINLWNDSYRDGGIYQGGIFLDQDISLTALSLDDAILPKGVHAYAKLVEKFPAYFVKGGRGSITITR